MSFGTARLLLSAVSTAHSPAARACSCTVVPLLPLLLLLLLLLLTCCGRLLYALAALGLSLSKLSCLPPPHPRTRTRANNHYQILRDSLGKLKLNDAALAYEPEASSAMGFGFRWVNI